MLFDGSNQILLYCTLLYSFMPEDLFLWMGEAKSGAQTCEGKNMFAEIKLRYTSWASHVLLLKPAIFLDLFHLFPKCKLSFTQCSLYIKVYKYACFSNCTWGTTWTGYLTDFKKNNCMAVKDMFLLQVQALSRRLREENGMGGLEKQWLHFK